ncbi:transport permease protein [Paenibacillus marchantiophytorum]|uniref:Transport permease protein n=1 Tax=Paenibacillus marchantiophytorum TaxID=1619310 RepID=A0ABQ2BTZ0_9BACL|nr:ABC transporter permease [Paenibacillus marchantiophytorum]GGI46252.1 transport permease protein [Paenibacillus marchantiophytorum]
MNSIWKYRKYIWDNSISELKNRYAGSSLGAVWNVLQPLFQILIFTYIFSQVMIAKLPNMESSSAFAIYLCAGLIPWISFSDIIVRGSNVFLANSTYLKKLAIPEYIFMLQISLTSTIILFISMGLLFFIVMILGQTVTLLWFLTPIILLMFIIFATGIAFIFASINVFFKDVGQFLVSFIQIWMWLTPIVYIKELLPYNFINIINYNPVYYFIDSLQQIIVYSKFPVLSNWTIMIVVTFFSFVLGILVLKILRSEIRDVI